MATGIIEKSNNGLFENEIEMNGNYATIVRHLKDDLSIFTTFREAYVTAAVIGFVHKRTETDGKQDKVQPASIFPNELNKRKQDLRLLYRIIMLVQDEPNFTIEDYMNRAFRDDSEEANAERLKPDCSYDVVAVEPDYQTQYGALASVNRGVCVVFGHEPDAVFGAQALDGCLILYHSHNYLPVARIALLAYNNGVAVQNTGVDHTVATHLERKQLDPLGILIGHVAADVLLRQYGLTCGDRAHDRHSLVAGLVFDRQRAHLAAVFAEIALILEDVEMKIHG